MARGNNKMNYEKKFTILNYFVKLYSIIFLGLGMIYENLLIVLSFFILISFELLIFFGYFGPVKNLRVESPLENSVALIVSYIFLGLIIRDFSLITKYVILSFVVILYTVWYVKYKISDR